MTAPAMRWCHGVPQVGTRTLTPEEVARLNGLLARNARWHRGHRVLTWTAGGAMVMSSVLLAVALPPSSSDGESLIGFALTHVALWIFVAGVFGTLAEVIFGFQRTSQVLFGVAWLAFGLTFVVDLPDKLALAVRAGTVMLAIFGGCTMMVGRISELRAFASIAGDLRLDLASGVVWQFAGATATWESEDHEKTDAEREHHSADVLPRSRIALRIDDVTTTRVVSMLVTDHPEDDVQSPMSAEADRP